MKYAYLLRENNLGARETKRMKKNVSETVENYFFTGRNVVDVF